MYKDKELKGCTFKPHINEKLTLEDNPKKRAENLYEAGIKMQLERKDKPKEEIEKERQIEYCTFKPDIDQ